MEKTLDAFLGELWQLASGKLRASHIGETSTPDELIYHYTTANGLKGILESKTIFATHYKCLNDLSEVKYGLDVGHEKLLTELEREREPLLKGSRNIIDDESIQDKQAAWHAYFDRHGKRFSLLNRAVEIIDTNPNSDRYITSFCGSKDLLSQWRGYTAGGGYAIGLRVRSGEISTSNGLFIASQVVYDRERQTEIVGEILDLVVSRLDEIPFPHTGDPAFKATTLKCAQIIVSLLNDLSIWCKDTAFSEEQEWRVYTEREPGDVESVKFRERDGILIPYLELPLITGGLSVEQIICGPTLNFALTKRSVKMLARKSGFENLEILKSNIPLGFY